MAKRARTWAACWLLSAATMSCGGAEDRRPGRPAPAGEFDGATGVSQAAGKQPAAAPASSATPASADGPHISRSGGQVGGLVVFWPRVIPATDDAKVHAYAKQLQQRLVALAEKKYPGNVDVRPEPERVCPQKGCAAATLGVLLAHGGGGCTAVGLVAKPGQAPTKLVPWAGVVTLKAEQVPFREYPESQITIRDAVPCDQLIDALAKNDDALEAAL